MHLSNVLIDLGEMPTPREAPAAIVTRRPPFPIRSVLGVVALVLLALTGGAVHQSPPTPPTTLPARLGDATFVDGDRLFVVSAGRPVLGLAEQNRVVSTYSLPSARLLGRTSVAVSGGVTWVWQDAGTVVVSYQSDASGVWGVVAVAAGTATTLWRRAARWIGASAADGLAVVETDDAEFGVDLATGRNRWSVPHPPDGFTASAGAADGFPRWVVSAGSGRLETRDARTGAMVAATTVSPHAGRTNWLIWPFGDLVMVGADGGGFDAYRLPDLRKAWHLSADLSETWSSDDCGAVLCMFRQDHGMTALDARTGRQVWTSDRWSSAVAAGPYLLAGPSDQPPGSAASDAAPALWVLDPASGRPLGNFGAWQGLGRAGGDLVYGKLEVPGQDRVYFARLDPGTRRIRVLGYGDRVSGGCETGDEVVICRLVDASISIWRLR